MKKFLLPLVLILLIGISTAESQVTISKIKKLKKPMFVVDVFGGYSLPILDLKGSSIKEYYNFANYAMSGGFQASTKVKFAIGTYEASQIRLYALFTYSHYTNDEAAAYNMPFVAAGWPSVGVNGSGQYVPPGGVSGRSNARINIPYAGLGFEYSVFVDEALRSSFDFGADIDMSSVFGRYYDQPTGQGETFNTLRANYRMGFGVNAQYNIRANENFGFTVGMRYMMHNILLKSTKVSDANGYMFLNDEANTDINPYITTSRNIGSFDVFGGVSFYIGKRK